MRGRHLVSALMRMLVGECPLRNPDQTCAFPLHRHRRTIVVGSSSSLRGSGLGHVIDSYQNVIRIDCAPVTSFEHDVGNRTTMRIVNGLDLVQSEGGITSPLRLGSKSRKKSRTRVQ